MPRLRYSLRTLLLATLFAASLMLLWRVRHAWALQTWPLHDAPISEPAWSTPVQSSFSPSSRYALMLPQGQSLGENSEACLLNLRTASIVRRFPEGAQFAWHATRDLLLCVANDRLELIALPENKVEASFPVQRNAHGRFSRTGQYVVEVGPRIIFHDMIDGRVVASLPPREAPSGLYYEYSISPDDRFVLVTEAQSLNYRLDFSLVEPQRPASRNVMLFDAETARMKWNWTVPEHVERVESGFDADGSSVSVSGAVDWSFELTKEENEELAQSKVNIFGSAKLNATFKLNKATGALLSRKVGFQSGTPDLQPPKAATDATALPAPEGEWRITLTPDSKRIAIGDSQSRGVICTLSAGGDRIVSQKWITLSPDKQHVLAFLEGNRFALWSRTRTNFEWWGIYERWELWLAFALLGAFLWSAIRDWKTRGV